MNDQQYAQWARGINADDLNDRLRSFGDDGMNDELSEYDSRFKQGGSWEPLPSAWFDDYLLAGSGHLGIRENPNWTLDRTDFGAFSFRASDIDRGLVIQLSSTLTDVYGYWLVVDPPGAPGGAYLARPRSGATPIPGTLIQSGVHKFNFARPTDLWVMYDHGTVTLGLGTRPGENERYRVVIPRVPPGMQQFAFTQVGAGDALGRITNVVSYRRHFPDQTRPPWARHGGAPYYLQNWRPGLYIR